MIKEYNQIYFETYAELVEFFKNNHLVNKDKEIMQKVDDLKNDFEAGLYVCEYKGKNKCLMKEKEYIEKCLSL